MSNSNERMSDDFAGSLVRFPSAEEVAHIQECVDQAPPSGAPAPALPVEAIRQLIEAAKLLAVGCTREDQQGGNCEDCIAEDMEAMGEAGIDRCPDCEVRHVLPAAESQLTALQQAVADAQKDKVALLRFAGKALYENRMLSIGDWDGGDLQDTAIECGLLEPFDVEGLCGEECRCAEVGFPATCYRFTPLANEAIDAVRTPDPTIPIGEPQ